MLRENNNLEKSNPELVKKWNYEKNGDLKPTQVTAGSNKKVWWKCSKGHEWQAKIASRSNGSGCPYCSNVKLLTGYNDLATTNPELAKEWNYEKNGDLKPTQVMKGCGKKVWWKCTKGHEWQTRIANRSKEKGCPYCSSQKVLAGYNDLATANPELA
ncbi:MAG: zinc-ribbon domain-containing protein, partial [Cyanobacteriota bacterium]|nr:zinc-ribbon domain-containing protein [Cyanobacteriota bacterium]